MSTDFPLRLVLENDLVISFTGLPQHADTEETVYEGSEQQPRQRALFSWFNSAGEKVAWCWAEQFKAIGTQPV